MKRSPHRTLAPALLAAALILTACSNDGSAEFDEGSRAQDQEQPEEGSEVGDGGGATDEGGGTTGDGSGSGVGVDAIDAADVLAEQEYTVPGSEDSATFGVHSLVVQGDIMTLYLTFTPDFASVEEGEPVALWDVIEPYHFTPVLVDRENLKEYSLIHDAPNYWQADSLEVAAVNGETAVWWGVFAAPEDDIDTVDLRIFDDMPEFTDVPITR